MGTDTQGSEYTSAVDIWALGCITYRLVTGHVPFPPGTSLQKYCAKNSLFPYDALFDSGIKSLCAGFIMELLQSCSKERPSASQALKHAWLISSLFTNKSVPLFIELT